jgi:hypothetical protein
MILGCSVSIGRPIMIPELQSIAQRLEEVEKQVAHLSALVTEQADPDRTIVGRSFVVRDAQGAQRAVLKVHEDYCSGLWLYDASDNTRAALTVQPDGGPSLALRDAKGRAFVDIVAEENGPRIHLWHPSGEQRLSLMVTEDGSWALLCNSNSKKRLTLHLSPGGEARLYMGDQAGPSLKLAVDSEGACLLLGKENEAIWSAP